LRIVPSKVLMLSMKTTIFAPRNSRKRPGVMNASSSRDSSWRSNSSFRCSAQGDDRDEERRREQHDRPQQRGQRLPRGLPDDHLAVAVPAREREQHGQEDRDRQQDVEPGEGVEAQEREDAVGGHGAAGRLREQAQHQVGEQDGGQDQEKPDRCRRQFPGQRTAEDHDAGKSFDFFAVICR
jgi:hypothetical protein